MAKIVKEAQILVIQIYILKYINPLTDFGFKKLQEHIFNRLFEAAEIAKFSKKEREAYEESLKNYRDIKNIVDTSREEGLQEGREEREIEIVKNCVLAKMDNPTISSITGLDISVIQEIRNNFRS